jgi:hypothetical protein
MNTQTIFIWLLPIGLFIFLLIRIFKGNDGKVTGSIAVSRKRDRWPYLLIIIILLAIIGFQHFAQFDKPTLSSKPVVVPICLAAITPDTLAEMINSSDDYIAGLFYVANFKKEKDRIWTTYTLNAPEWDGKDPDQKVLEYAYTRDDWPGWIFYIFKRKDRYDSFIQSLNGLRCDSIEKGKISTLNNLTGGFKSFAYKNAILIDRGYWDANKGFGVEVFKKEILYSSNKNSVHDCLQGKEDWHFRNSGNTTDFIRLYGQHENVFHFAGRIDDVAINGTVEKSGDNFLIVSGNATGKFTLMESCQILLTEVTSSDGYFSTKHSEEFAAD